MPSVQTRYMGMLLDLDEVPKWHNILIAFCTWVLLAGFVIVPGTFTTLQKADAVKEGAGNNAVEHAILKTVRNAPLLWIAGLCCVIGALGMVSFWIRWRNNYVWVISRIFLPGLLNSIAGLISTLVNVFTAQKGVFSISAKVTTIVTGICTLIMTGLFVVYNNWALEKVKEGHIRELKVGEDGVIRKGGVVKERVQT
ncbi:MAG: hypothetical protein M1817_002968 [Caeruleum heppii]|nr:MAG: hypothetical protein M1817_002968 [Caeruleum heppii]